MNVSTPKRKTSFAGLFGISLITTLFGFYIMNGLRESDSIYSTVQNELNDTTYSSVGKVTFPETDDTLIIPSWTLFSPGNIWSLVSGNEVLDKSFVPNNLVALSLPHGDSAEEMKVQQSIVDPLTRLYAAAEEAGYPLMLSSAYRSISDQQALYDDFVATKGQSAADRYVADPGSSEHHTGLAVDFSDRSSTCSLDSDKCSLSYASGVWLARNAYKFGFILRYPEGEQPTTGIAYESWHYRYVGIPLAALIQESDLTLDEALEQMYPAFAAR